MKSTIIIFFLVLFASCKNKSNQLTFSIIDAEKQDNKSYVYVLFYNNSDKDVRLPLYNNIAFTKKSITPMSFYGYSLYINNELLEDSVFKLEGISDSFLSQKEYRKLMNASSCIIKKRGNLCLKLELYNERKLNELNHIKKIRNLNFFISSSEYIVDNNAIHTNELIFDQYKELIILEDITK